MTSQEAMTLLERETGIAVKSASSSIEEIVARQFVERHAKKRQISLPQGPLFSDAPVAKKPAGKTPGKTPEPPKPAAPALRPRLIKVVKPLPTAGEAEHETLAAPADTAAHVAEVETPVAHEEPVPPPA